MQTTATEQVYAHLLSRILHNELKPGDWVERKQLAEGMKTSLMPIAEAVQRLTLMRLLEKVPLGRPNSHFTRRWLNWLIVRRFWKTTCASSTSFYSSNQPC